MKFVAVRWLDAYRDESGDVSWTDLQDLKPVEVIDTGYLVYEDQDRVTLGSALLPKDRSFRWGLTIPRVLVVGMVEAPEPPV